MKGLYDWSVRGTREPSPQPSVPWPGQVVAAALRPSARPADLGPCFPSLRLADAAFPFHGLKANPPPAKMVPLASLRYLLRCGGPDPSCSLSQEHRVSPARCRAQGGRVRGRRAPER